jgi:F0F1-type ATP synthase assembly protein I
MGSRVNWADPVVADGVPTVAHPPEDRTPLSTALALASQLTAVALEMVVPIVGGYFLDQWLRTRVVFLAAGAVLGFYIGMRSLLSMTQPHRPNGEHPHQEGERPNHKDQSDRR